jgi:alpha-tubulin N-acetyltransferase 1
MQFEFDVARACGAQVVDGSPEIVRIEEAALHHPRWGDGLRFVLDSMGERSRRAQGLGKAVTSGRSACLAGNNVYLLVAADTVLGLLKTGPKKLFVTKSSNDGLAEINPQCVLDFYIVEGKQRAGFGRSLFEGMLTREGVRPEKLAYDRPSPKLLGFLQKHYGLSRYTPQNNNFVVYDAYFHQVASTSRPAAPTRSQPLEPATSHRDRRQRRAQDNQMPARVVAMAAEALFDDHREQITPAGMPSGRRPIRCR